MAQPRKPEGVVEKKGRWYYRPTSERERIERAKKGLPETVPLGLAGSDEARKKWAELTGRRETGTPGTVAELLGAWAMLDERGKPAAGAPIWRKDNGKPRAQGTVTQYAWAIRKVLMPRFGAMRYGKTAIEAASGRAIGTVDVQRMVADIGTTSANVFVACLSSVFMWAKRNGRTTYNPCEDVAKIAQEGSTREAKPWEVECLGAMAEATRRRRMALEIDFESISGWRACDILGLVRKQLTPEGIKGAMQKNGRKILLQWNDDLKRIIRDALELPGAIRAGVFPLSPVFASRTGGRQAGPSFWAEFRRLLERTNVVLGDGVIDPATLERHAAIAIEELTFHALRAKAGDDAEEDGREMHEFLGNTAAVAQKHYARRERKIVPLNLKR